MKTYWLFGLTLGIAALLCVTAASLTQWPGEMIAPFRPQVCLATLVGLALAAASRSRAVSLLAGAVCLLNAMPMAVRWFDRPVLPSPSQVNLSLLSVNVLFDNPDRTAVSDLIRREQTDVVVAVETGTAWVSHLDTLKDAYPYSATLPDEGPFGLSLYGRQPLSARVIELGPRRLPLLRAEFANYVVYAVHPMPPATASMTVDNRVYLQQLAETAQAETKPVILAGDFNTTLWSANVRPFLKDRWQWPSGSGLAYTWPVGRPYLGIQIDHILTQRMKAGRLRVLESVGSDHRPVRADLTW